MSSRSLVVMMLGVVGAGAILWMGAAHAQQSAAPPAAPPATRPAAPAGAQQPGRSGSVGVPVDPLDAARDPRVTTDPGLRGDRDDGAVDDGTGRGTANRSRAVGPLDALGGRVGLDNRLDRLDDRRAGDATIVGPTGMPVDPLDSLRGRGGRTMRNPDEITERTRPFTDVERGDLEEGTLQNLETDPLEALRSRGGVVERDAPRDDRGETGAVGDRTGAFFDDNDFFGSGALGFGLGTGAPLGGGGGGQMGQAGGMRVVPVTPAELAGAPERYLGRAVVVRGDVDGLESANLFTLDEDSVLIVNPVPDVGLRGDEDVIVTGVVRRLVDDDMRGEEERYGLSPPALRSLQGRAVIVAQSVRVAPGR